MPQQFPRRSFLAGSAALTLSSIACRVSPAVGAAASTVGPALIAAAQKEGNVVWYTSVDLPVAEKVAKAFESRYPAISVRVERNGSERLFQRIEQELASGIHAGDLVNTSDGAHFVIWKREGRLEKYLTTEAAQFLPKSQIDQEGAFMRWRGSIRVL